MISRYLLPICAIAVACRASPTRVTPAGAPLWGRLEAGPFAVGVKQFFATDATRPSLRFDSASTSPSDPSMGRQMQIVVWYPASRDSGNAVTLRDYVEMSAGLLGSSLSTDERRRRAVERFVSQPLANGAATSRMDDVLGTPMRAVIDAPLASGRFPLIVFLHASPWGESVMSEYLASHGFVVAAIESKGVQDVAYRLSRENLDAMTRDAGFVVSRLRREPNVGDGLGVIGMSNGAIAAMALQLTGLTPDAVVSLDGGIGERAGGTFLDERSGGVLSRFTVPLLHLYTADNRFLDLQYIRSYQAQARTLVRFDALRHWREGRWKA